MLYWIASLMVGNGMGAEKVSLSVGVRLFRLSRMLKPSFLIRQVLSPAVSPG